MRKCPKCDSNSLGFDYCRCCGYTRIIPDKDNGFWVRMNENWKGLPMWKLVGYGVLIIEEEEVWT